VAADVVLVVQRERAATQHLRPVLAAVLGVQRQRQPVASRRAVGAPQPDEALTVTVDEYVEGSGHER